MYAFLKSKMTSQSVQETEEGKRADHAVLHWTIPNPTYLNMTRERAKEHIMIWDEIVTKY